MTTRRVLPLLLAVAGLVALAALAAHGHPLTGSRGAGPTSAFFDYVFTTIAIVFAAVLLVFLYSLLGSKWSTPTGRPRFSILQFVLSMVVALLFAFVVLHARFNFLGNKKQQKGQLTHALTPDQKDHPNPASIRSARLRWDEVAIVAALLAAAGVAAFASRKAKPVKPWRLRSQEEEIALALDESLDDLRTDPDVRRAIIAAYARMERALAAAGIPRRPSEAPFEYLPRALASLHTSAASVTRLTDLFEHAKFSHHDPDESMREDAIAA
ncbi:MAG: DUF4129 domain-containing protein, partial [Gaiellaceae bacterium]